MNASTTLGNTNSTTTIPGFLNVGIAAPNNVIIGSTTLAQFYGNFNSFAQIVVGNVSTLSNASADIVFNNSLSGTTNANYYGNCGENGSSYSQPIAFPNDRANDFYCFSSDGGFVFGSASTTLSAASSSVRIMSGGSKVWEAYRDGRVFMGTSTPAFAQETIATSTGPQLALVDGLGNGGWTLRAISNNFYLATSTATATSTPAAFTIFSSGQQQIQSNPPSHSFGTGAGTSPILNTIVGNSSDFVYNITTGSTPTGSNATIDTFTMPTACAHAPVPTWSDSNKNTDALAVVSVVYASSTDASTFILVSGATGLTGATNYIWNFHVGCY